MGENHEKITYYNKKYTKITLLGFIRKPNTNDISCILPRKNKKNLINPRIILLNNTLKYLHICCNKTLYLIILLIFVYSFTGFLGKTEMGENREKITYYTKKYTKITLLSFIETPLYK